MEIPAESVALTLLRPQLRAEESVRETVTEPCETQVRSPTSNRPGESCWTPPGHERGGNSWCLLSREASREGVRPAGLGTFLLSSQEKSSDWSLVGKARRVGP